MTDLPVKIGIDGTWASAKLALGTAEMQITGPKSFVMPNKSIIDLDAKGSVLTITLKGQESQPVKIASVDKVLNVLRRHILATCNAYRLAAYFMSPAIRGGVFVKDARWEKGGIAVLKSGIWFFSNAKQICVPLADVASIELTKREVQGKNTDVVKIEHIEGSEVVTSFVLCPLTTLQVLYNFLKDATKSMDMEENLDPKSAQVAMLVYSGMDTASIENMLGVSLKDIDHVYDTLINLGLAEVVTVRREVKLTTKGVRYITDATKV